MGTVITFAQQKGGSGKTTLLVHLAHSWLLAGKTVAVVDLDPQRSLTRWGEFGTIAGLDLVESKDYRAGADIRAAARDHDLVLVDCPGNASTLLEAALRASDLVIVPCQPTAMDVWASEAILKMARKENTRAVVVLNRVAPRGNAADDTRRVLRAGGAHVLDAQLGNRVAFASGFADGRTAFSLSLSSAAVSEIEILRAEIDATAAQKPRGVFGR
jgi:chromosome partitioning protein